MAKSDVHLYSAIIADDWDTKYLKVMIWGEDDDLVCTLNVNDESKTVVIHWSEFEDRRSKVSDCAKFIELLVLGHKTLRDAYPEVFGSSTDSVEPTQSKS